MLFLMNQEISKIYTIFFNALSHKMRTPLSTIQNNLSYMDKTKRVSDCDISLRKVDELTKTIGDLNIEVKNVEVKVCLAQLENTVFFREIPTFFDSKFKESLIGVDLNALNKLINYFNLVARVNFNCRNLVAEGFVENAYPILNIAYDSPSVNLEILEKTDTYLSFLTQSTLKLDVLNAALYDLNASHFNLVSEFSISKEMLALKIKFLG